MKQFDEKTYGRMQVRVIDANQVLPNPYQPRRVFDALAMQELADSIKQHGVMQPISVRRMGSYYELIAGERRLRASKMAGYTTIPAIVFEQNDQESALIALVENIQRQDLNYFEEADGYRNLMEDHGLTQEEIAKIVGKSQSAVANKLRLLKLSPEIRQVLIEQHLTERHARLLLRISEPERWQYLRKIVSDGLNVAQSERLVEEGMGGSEIPLPQTRKRNERKTNMRGYFKDLRLFTNTVKKAVDMMKTSGMVVDMEEEKREDYYEVRIRIPMR
ncbi:MAG: nucleoid occlusion protein [Lachnospirales bacterium]